MCGRFALYANENEIVSHFNLRSSFCMRPRYNISPSEMIPVVVENNQIEFCRWGFLPSWTKIAKGEALPLGQINARFESIEEKPFFKKSFAFSRCLIPVSGYYEWKHFPQKKQPFYFHLPQEPLFALGGIRAKCQGENGSLTTLAILTVEASGRSAQIHTRMPYIVPKAHYDNWLQGKPLKQKEPFAFDTFLEKISIYPVTSQMNHPSFDNVVCIESL